MHVVRVFGRLIVGLALALGGCNSAHELAAAHGPLFPLNPGRWQWTDADLAKPAPENVP